jgi:hypothetical protein
MTDPAHKDTVGRTICRTMIVIFLLLYLLALSIFAIGTFGLFGQEQDPLSGVYLIPLGLPWNRFLESFSDGVKFWLALAAPALNLLILRVICGVLAFRDRP